MRSSAGLDCPSERSERLERLVMCKMELMVFCLPAYLKATAKPVDDARNLYGDNTQPRPELTEE